MTYLLMEAVTPLGVTVEHDMEEFSTSVSVNHFLNENEEGYNISNNYAIESNFRFIVIKMRGNDEKYAVSDLTAYNRQRACQILDTRLTRRLSTIASDSVVGLVSEAIEYTSEDYAMNFESFQIGFVTKAFYDEIMQAQRTVYNFTYAELGS